MLSVGVLLFVINYHMYLMNLIEGSFVVDNSILTDEESKSFVACRVKDLLENVEELHDWAEKYYFGFVKEGADFYTLKVAFCLLTLERVQEDE